MTRIQLIRKLYASTFALTILYGLPFGVITYFVNDASNHRTPVPAVISGLIFGILMGRSQKKRLNKTLKIIEDNEVSQNKQFNAHLKHGKVPESASKKKQMVTYMDELEARQSALKTNNYPKKYSKILAYSIILLFFILTLSLKQLRILAAIYPVVLVMGLYGEYKNHRLRQRIAVVRDKLQ